MACQQASHGDSSFKKAPYHLPAANSIYHLLREGDVILRQGTGPFSTEIVNVMGEKNPVSHCGLILRTQGKLMVVQSISAELSKTDGIQLQDLQSFIDDTADSNLFIVRYKDTAIAARVATEALNLLEKKLPFDHEYNLKDHSKIYCAELPYLCFTKHTGIDFLYRKTEGPSLIRFDSFFQSKYFSKVFACRSIAWIK